VLLVVDALALLVLGALDAGLRRPFGVLEWPALLAKLDKIDPSYRD
jgi:hypothetical protein